ncbi:MAG TPA: hypothetical protein VNA14_03100 [Mycobacteriales bacterium]|nr:hypothetical protein [Mycobacteriales bacterium]
MTVKGPSAGFAGTCSALSAAVWVAQYLHARVTHGPTSYNRADVALGMTWFDSAKFLVLSFLLLVPAALAVGRRTAECGRPASRPVAAVVVALSASAVGTALQFWPADWGSYAGTDAPSGPAYWGGPVQAVSSALLLPVAFAWLGVTAARAGALPWWLVPVLVVGGVTSAFLGGPLPPIPGIAWSVLGGWLLVVRSGEQRRPSPALTGEERPVWDNRRTANEPP